jgi:hypothetical protein
MPAVEVLKPAPTQYHYVITLNSYIDFSIALSPINGSYEEEKNTHQG